MKSQAVEAALLGNSDRSDNAFVRVDGAMFARYDEMMIIPSADGVCVLFRWKGTPIYEQSVTALPATGHTLTIGGLDGKIKLTLG